MNRSKWQNKFIPFPMLALKLVEEVGEVSNEITDDFMEGDPSGGYVLLMSDKRRETLVKELDDVVFIALEMKKRLEHA